MMHAPRSLVSILTVSLFALGAGNPSSAQTACDAARLTASDSGVFESFGFSVAVCGDTALIGAQWNLDNGPQSGSAYVFGFDWRSHTWTETQLLLGSDGDSSDHFGVAVAIEGETALIGAFAHLHSDNGGSGSAYVFRLNGSSWIEHQELLASDGAIGDHFGISVSISGEVAVIGAELDDDNGANSGSAYVFRYDSKSDTWVEEQKLLASDGAAGNFFGAAVAIGADTIVIGADGPTSGSTYVFRFDADSSRWIEEQNLIPPDGPGDQFGVSVSISGDAILIGAPFDVGGSAYVFRFDPAGQRGSQWVQEQKLLASDPGGTDQFGRAVALDGDTAVIGAFNSDAGGLNSGAAYLFRFDGKNWVEQQQLLPEPNPWGNNFGWSVSLDGDTAVIGAHFEDQQAGAAYVLDLSVCLCPTDLDGDGSVGILDLLALLAAWGTDPGGPPDFDGDGTVGILDLLTLLAAWGPCQ